MIRFRRSIAATLLALIAFSNGVQATNRVFVKSEASDEYLIQRSRDPSKTVQTYQFMKGKYHPGNKLDPSMGKMTFEELAYDLALQLRKQDFYPEPELGKSDLLIVVHYGSTGYQDDYFHYEGTAIDYRFQYFDELGDLNRPRGLEGLSNIELVHVTDTSHRAKLLGMDFTKTWASDKRLLSILSSEPRYFVILCAYDFPLLLKGEVTLLWRTRYSIRTVGQSFTGAIIHMNRIASDYMGHSMKGFVQKRTDDSSFVSYGEIEVIDIEEVKAEDRSTDFLHQDLPNVPEGLRNPQFE